MKPQIVKYSPEIIQFLKDNCDSYTNGSDKFFHLNPVYRVVGYNVVEVFYDHKELPEWVSFCGRLKGEGNK